MLDKHFRSIYITLGFECNFNCLYCLQDDGYTRHTKCYNEPALSDKLLKYLDKYPYKDTKILFWGGEPLLYFKSIKKIVERYGEKFSYAFSTNGSLLTEDIVAYLEEHKITFALSHDGEATKRTRGVDVLENKRIKNILLNTSSFRNFSSVYSKENNDYMKLISYFKEQGFNKPIQVDLIYNTNDTQEQRYLTSITAIEYQKTLQDILHQYHKEEAKPILKQRFWYLLNQLNHPELLYDCNVQCNACRESLNLDYEGNVYICHNSVYKLGTVEDNYDVIYRGYCEYLEKHFKAKCKNCDINHLCSGACLLLTERGQEDYCRIRQAEIATLMEWLEKMKGELTDDTSTL